MTYQIAIFDRGGECWRLYREDFKLIAFASLEEAETRALELSASHSSCQVLVLTLHACFSTETEYPPPKPITRTERIDIKTVMASGTPKETT